MQNQGRAAAQRKTAPEHDPEAVPNFDSAAGEPA